MALGFWKACRRKQWRHLSRLLNQEAVHRSSSHRNPKSGFPPFSSNASNLYGGYARIGERRMIQASKLEIIRPNYFQSIFLISTSSDTSESKNGGIPIRRIKEEDGPSSSYVDRYLPPVFRPYAHLARLDKPIGTWLLAWPCMWSITLAANPGNLPDLKLLALFGCGALLLRGAGCTVNDLFDRDIDTQVERTKMRPVACGVLSPFQGLSFLGIQLLLGLGILLQLNNYSRVLGASSLLLVFSYPLMKRLTYWPQAYLGLTINWGALLGWSAVRETIDPSIVLPLYASGVLWTLVYDTIYAHQDKEDDIKVGIKSTALRFGSSTKHWISGFGISCVSGLALCGYNANLGWPYYACLVGAAGQLSWQIWTVDLTNRADCNRKSLRVGPTILAREESIYFIPTKQ